MALTLKLSGGSVLKVPGMETCLRRNQLLCATERLAEGWRSAPADDSLLERLKVFNKHGLFAAPLPLAHGGLGLGTEPGGHLPLLRVLSAVGGTDLALGRIYEGHVNALLLIVSYGSPEQITRAAADAHAGLLFGVWNTGEGAPMRLDSCSSGLTLQGCKGFASGAAFVQRPIVTADHGGWQMTLPRMEQPGVATALRVDSRSWQPFGMESSASYTIDLSGARLSPEDLIGAPGDLYREPLFRGGAIRFAAVQTGAILRLAELFRTWLVDTGRAEQPYQVARMGEIALAAQEAALRIEHAAAVAEDCLWPGAGAKQTRDMIDTANATRLAIERLATATMPRIISGIGAHGLLRPAGFEGILRDLTMYLRQPNPDGALADLGRSSLTQDFGAWWTTSAEPSA